MKNVFSPYFDKCEIFISAPSFGMNIHYIMLGMALLNNEYNKISCAFLLIVEDIYWVFA